MTKPFKRIIVAAIVLILLAAGATAFVVMAYQPAGANDPIAGVKNSAVNTLLNATGIKDRIDSELRTKAGAMAEQVGISQSTVDNVVDSLAIPEWEATTLPETAVQADSFNLEVAGTQTKVTTYDDPSVVTVEAMGQSVTMAVPESAQSYIPYLGYFQMLQ